MAGSSTGWGNADLEAGSFLLNVEVIVGKQGKFPLDKKADFW
jgi:hypothetical protein